MDVFSHQVIVLFQQQDGVDVCLYCIYVQEYGDDCAAPNTCDPSFPRALYICKWSKAGVQTWRSCHWHSLQRELLFWLYIYCPHLCYTFEMVVMANFDSG